MIPLEPTYEEVNALFHYYPMPFDHPVHLVDYNNGDHYGVRFYREEFDKLTPMNKWAIMDWANKTIGLMNDLIPTAPEIWVRPGVRK